MQSIQLTADPREIELLEAIDRKLDRLLNENAEKMFTVNEAAKIINISPQQLRIHAERGDIEAITVGSGRKNNFYRFTRSSIEAFQKGAI